MGRGAISTRLLAFARVSEPAAGHGHGRAAEFASALCRQIARIDTRIRATRPSFALLKGLSLTPVIFGDASCG